MKLTLFSLQISCPNLIFGGTTDFQVLWTEHNFPEKRPENPPTLGKFRDFIGRNPLEGIKSLENPVTCIGLSRDNGRSLPALCNISRRI